MHQRILIALLCVLICTFTVLADSLQLKDGTTLQGRVIDQGEKYWIKDDNGTSHLVPKDSVLSWTKGADGAAVIPAPASPGGAAASAKATNVGSSSFNAVKLKADQAETAIAAVGLWQAFIDKKPSPADLTAAQAQRQHWQEVMDGNGEKVNGKWLWGPEREKVLVQVRKLMKDGTAALNSNQTLVGIAKFEEAVKLYPSNFEANFELGYFNLVKGIDGGRNNAKIEAGIKSLEAAVFLRPDCAEALSDLSIGYNIKQKYVLSVETAYRAAKLQDSKGIVQNLVTNLAFSPPGIQNNSKVKTIIQETLLLATKYSIDTHSTSWTWVRPDDNVATAKKEGGEDDSEEAMMKRPGIVGEGTGFFVSPDGYILTNRHVAKPGDYLMVRLSDNTLRLAERIIIDDEQDMAVLKIKLNDPVPFVRLASYEHPSVGADVAVFGFPLAFDFGLKSTVKMTRGIVTAWDQGNELCDVTVDAIVNPGNSGGPMVDHHGNLLALTAMKTVASDGTISTYGLGYSTERVRKFFKKQHEKLAAAKLEAGSENGSVLTNEQLAMRITPVTVCILICNGTVPSMNGDGSVKVPKKPAAKP